MMETSKFLDAVRLDLDGLQDGANCLARGHGLHTAEGGDLRQTAYVSMTRWARKYPEAAGKLLRAPAKRLAFVKKCLINTTRTLLRKQKLQPPSGIPIDEIESIDGRRFCRLEVEDAQRIIEKIKIELGEKGLFALEVFLVGTTPEELALKRGMSTKTGKRWFVKGLKWLAKAIERVLYREFGDEAASAFVWAVSVLLQNLG